MIAQTFRGPHSLYRRYQALFESTVTSFGFAILVALTLNSLDAYPENWLLVLGLGLALVGIRWPLAAFVIAIVALTYPIYLINLYLAVLFIAVTALGHRLFIHHIGATALVLSTPLLAQYHLHWLVPVLAGLWWGGLIGAWVGGLAAIWGKFIWGMAAMDIDWLTMAGQAPDVEAITARFQNANSLDTLLLLIEPFAISSAPLLYNILQVAGWVLAGGVVGSLATRKWVKHNTPWSIMVVTAGGGLILLITHIGLPFWLPDAVAAAAVAADPVAPLVSLMVVIIVGTTVYSLRESLDLPVAPKQNIRAKAKKQPFGSLKRSGKQANPRNVQAIGRAGGERRRPVRVPDHSELPEWAPPKNDSDLIMLEID